ncbi:DUF397 domain-containing protein [Streptomyces turgidiscabies]|uniref:DUF397 domain-containing protein n=1 Tax=Streptomyces turgidiscabies TaxID=85558 RepID=A0ABU0RNM5_9ACTN|nr:DUF397 domain-containing protein [Streptomyces turgidiscabies]MDQ0933591.1 hypothetical protein [Streptomyces turgidiscabies]
MTPKVVGPFRKSSYSQQEGACIEVAVSVGDGRAVRDSKDKTGPVLFFDRAEWSAFLLGAKDGEFDH